MSSNTPRPAAEGIELDELPVETVELSGDEAAQVQGGGGKTTTQSVTVNKAKTADKAFNAMDAYIKG